ncbi:MAG: hypothetical protein ACXWL2_02700 [Candidatus Chromulinivorax sp.]
MKNLNKLFSAIFLFLPISIFSMQNSELSDYPVPEKKYASKSTLLNTTGKVLYTIATESGKLVYKGGQLAWDAYQNHQNNNEPSTQTKLKDTSNHSDSFEDVGNPLQKEKLAELILEGNGTEITRTIGNEFDEAYTTKNIDGHVMTPKDSSTQKKIAAMIATIEEVQTDTGQKITLPQITANKYLEVQKTIIEEQQVLARSIIIPTAHKEFESANETAKKKYEYALKKAQENFSQEKEAAAHNLAKKIEVSRQYSCMLTNTFSFIRKNTQEQETPVENPDHYKNNENYLKYLGLQTILAPIEKNKK